MASNASDFPFGIMDVVELLPIRKRRPGANSFYVDCPFCGDGRGKMNVNYVKNTWRCNYCGESGGMLSLYARMNHISNSDAYREICDALSMGETSWGNGNDPKGAGAFQGKTGTCKKEEIPQSPRASVQEIHQTYSLMLEMLSLVPKHLKHLMSEKRGLTEEQIQERNYKSTPPFFLCRSLAERLANQGCTVQGVPGFYLDEKGRWTINFSSKTAGILIPCVGIDGLIKGLQILLDVPLRDKDDPPEKKGAKYIWLSSSSKNMGTTSGSQVHFVGDPFARTIYVTEGLLKADIAHYQMNRSFAAVAGANNVAELDTLFGLLAANGTEQIVEAHDMDKFSNEAIYKGKLKIYQIAAKHGMKCLSLTWNPNYKGVDDWQLALKRKEKREKEVQLLNFKEQYLLGLCEISHIENKTEEWHCAPEEKIGLAEYLGLSSEEYGIFVKDGEAILKTVLDMQRRYQYFRFYQLDFGEEQKPIKFAFKGIHEMRKAGFQQPPTEKYKLSYESRLMCPAEWTEEQVLQYLRKFYGESVPGDYRGRALAESDIVELYNHKESQYYYVDSNGCKIVPFAPKNTESTE